MPIDGSPAEGYGCQTFATRRSLPEPDYTLRSYRYFSGIREDVGGVIDEDTVWQADTIHVVEDVTIADGVELVVQPGVQVVFDGYYALRVQGTLTAVGTADERIRFASSNPVAFTIDDAQTGCWHGIRFDNTPSHNQPSRIAFCEIEYSKAVGEEPHGGAFYLFGFSKVRIENCLIRNCLALRGGAFYCTAHASPEIVGNLINKCYALETGSIIISVYAYPKLICNTMTGNTLLNESEFDNTLPVHNFISKPILYNNIVYGNQHIYFLGGQIYEGKPYYIRFNDIEEGYDGEGNIADDPGFHNAGDDPFTLGDNSPCIDAGTSDIPWIELPATDIVGNPRIHNGRIDMGCYEWDPTTDSDPIPPDIVSDLELRIYPNPFYPTTNIEFSVAERGRTTLTIYNVRGQKIATLIDEDLSEGSHIICWDATDTVTGIYFCMLQNNGKSKACKMLLLRWDLNAEDDED